MTTIYANISTLQELTRGNSIAKTQGIISSTTLAVNTTTTLDWAFPEERWLTGGLIIASGTWGSHLTIQIVDKDNVLGAGAGYVASEFITQFYIADSQQIQLTKEFNYPALIPAGLYIRVLYYNSSLISLGKVALNIFTHIPKA